MTIWELVYEEMYNNNGVNLLDSFKQIHKNWRRGFISDIQARILCEREYDETHNIYK